MPACQRREEAELPQAVAKSGAQWIVAEDEDVHAVRTRGRNRSFQRLRLDCITSSPHFLFWPRLVSKDCSAKRMRMHGQPCECLKSVIQGGADPRS